MQKSKIFVTGGSGKAGKYLIPYLLKKQHNFENIQHDFKKSNTISKKSAST